MDRSFDNAGFKPTVAGEAGRMFGGQVDGFPGNNGGRPLHNDPPGLQGGPWGVSRDVQPRRGDDFVDPFGNRPPIDTPRNEMPGRNFGRPDIRPEFGGKGRDGDWGRPGFKLDASRDFDRIDDVRDFRRPGDERRDFGRPDDRRDFPRPSDNMNRDFNRPEHEREFRLGADRGMMGGPDRGMMGGADRGMMGGPDRGMMGGPDRGMMGGPDRGMMGGPDRGMMGGADRMFPGNELNDDFQRQKEPFGRERRIDPMENNLLRGKDFPEPGGFRDQRPQFDPIPSNPVAKFGVPSNNFPGEFGQQPLMQMPDRWHGDASADRFDPARRNMSPPRDARPPFPGFGGPHPEDDWQGHREQRPGFNGPSQRSLCIRVSNLPLLYNYREVRRFFRGCEIPNDGLKIINDRSGNRTGICFVRFGQPQHFLNALTHDGKVIDNCKISVVKCSNQEYEEAVDGYKPPRDRSRSPMRGKRSPDRGQRHELYVVIKKLPTNFEKADVKKFLGNAHIAEGGGPFVEIGRDGHRTGNALVELERRKDFDEAVSLHMSKFQGCIVNVFAISKREYEERIVKAKERQRRKYNGKTGQ